MTPPSRARSGTRENRPRRSGASEAPTGPTYLDCKATMPIDPRVVAAMDDALARLDILRHSSPKGLD